MAYHNGLSAFEKIPQETFDAIAAELDLSSIFLISMASKTLAAKVSNLSNLAWFVYFKEVETDIFLPFQKFRCTFDSQYCYKRMVERELNRHAMVSTCEYCYSRDPKRKALYLLEFILGTTGDYFVSCCFSCLDQKFWGKSRWAETVPRV